MPPRNLRPSERPLLSEDEDDLENRYARRRLITTMVALAVVGYASYAIWPHHPRDPNDIPTIQAGPPVKERPADPGGIDIPHQDVEVYNEISGGGAASPVEHLLPPPEAPTEPPPAAAPPSTPLAVIPLPEPPPAGEGILTHPIPAPVAEDEPMPAPVPAAEKPVEKAAIEKPVVEKPAPPMVSKAAPTTPLDGIMHTAPVPTTVATAPVPAAAPVPAQTAPVPAAPSQPKAMPVKKETRNLTIDEILRRTQAGHGVPAPASITVAGPAGPAETRTTLDTHAPAPPLAVQMPTPPAPTHAAHVTGGQSALQLASVDDQGKAQSMMADLQRRYAAQLGGVHLRLARAEVAGRGVHYRIQSPAMSASEAAHMCSALKQAGAGCILVRK